MKRSQNNLVFQSVPQNRTWQKQEGSCKRYYFSKIKYKRKMLSEDFDKKIKLAAEQHHPAYDEKAWLKMEKMLSRYLPLQKRDRRRAFFFLLLSLLIIGGGIFVIISKPWTNRSHFTEQLPQGNKNKPQTKNIEKADSNNINFTHTEVSKKNTREAANEDFSAQPQIKNTFTGKTINHPFPND